MCRKKAGGLRMTTEDLGKGQEIRGGQFLKYLGDVDLIW